ncbi:MAG: hypothetical protein ACI4VE_00745 [Clostridia bacterium]
MTKQEVITFLERIKANYQSFLQTPYVLEEWYDRLKDYDKEDVYKKFEEHLNGELSSQIPKAHFITRYLTKSSDKGKEKNYRVICGNCKKVLLLSEYQNHMERHNSIEYMKTHSDMFSVFNEEKLLKMSEEDFKKIYDPWIEKLYNHLEKKADKSQSELEEMKRIENYVMSKAGMEISIN